ncbi:MAG: response regulator [Candidatus Omnitrophica bacterium]|nr:response regulator [Candidatus Omnitrophota bacterium]
MAHKILIIDDDKINTAIVRLPLAEARYDISVAHDGDAGLALVKEIYPDLIILDVYMPKMNGYEFMQELKTVKEGYFPDVIMLTANETLEAEFKLEGVKGYFVKPVEHEPLLKKIVECLGPNSI